MALQDIYKKASLVMKPAAMKEGKVYSQQPHSGDGDFTFSRANGVQTRINKHGLIENVADNTPRLSYDLDDNGNVSECPTLLLEPTRTNLIEYSELFSNSYWTKENVSVGNGIVSPYGNSKSEELTESTSTGRHRVRAIISVSSGTTYSLSVWAKSTDRNLVVNAQSVIGARSGFNLSTGVVENTASGSATIIAFPNDWFLCTVTGTATSTQTQVFYLQMQTGTTDTNYTGNGSSTLSLFGAQVEVGSYATSYIPTSGSSEDRAVETCVSGNDEKLFNDSEGVLFADLEALAEGTVTRKICITNGGTDFVNLNFNATSGKVDFEFGSVLNSFYIVNSTGHTLTNRNKIAIKYKSGDTDCYINGTRVAGNSGTFTLSGLDRVNFENRATNGSQVMYSKMSQLIVFNEALSDSELIELTS